MKIVHLNTLNFGGASNSAKMLHLGLLNLNQNSTFVTLRSAHPKTKNHFFYEELNASRIRFKIRNVLRNPELKKDEKRFIFETTTKETDWFSFIETPFYPETLEIVRNADIIHLHWVADFINWNTFFKKIKKKRIIWTLHDMNPFTGGYHYSEEYNGHVELTSKYPYLAHTQFNNLVNNTLIQKSDILKRNNVKLEIISPSKWLASEAQKSFLFKSYPISVVPYGIDTSIFKIVETNQLKAGLKIDKNPVILVIADNLDNKRKGYHLLTEAFKRTKTQLNLMVVGQGKLTIDSPFIKCYHLGAISSRQQICEIYNLADYYVICSLQDNLPNTVLESLCCGTPVIGFNSGGIPDMVNNDNGIIGDKSIEFLITVLDNLKLYSFDKQLISNNAIKLYSLENQASAYIDRIYR
jgi:glycosyltransferase involved in cell wall biosynthesis